MITQEAIHESGHAILLIYHFKRFPRRVVVGEESYVRADLGWPLHGNEATKFAAYFYAGKTAVEVAISKQALPATIDPLVGFSTPYGPGCDQFQIDGLKHWVPDLQSARSLATRVIASHWQQVFDLADALGQNASMDQAALMAFLL